ncbi:MAG: hypothetical protein J0L58_16800 [Burkholderiales bacterium]|nr:hypothetical protein [Burkholderiales bacterium]
MVDQLIPALIGAFAVAGPVVGWLVRLERRMTTLEVTIRERLPAPHLLNPKD